jgi:hypothetical protein
LKNFPRKTFSFSSQFFLESFLWKVFQVSFFSAFKINALILKAVFKITTVILKQGDGKEQSG